MRALGTDTELLHVCGTKGCSESDPSKFYKDKGKPSGLNFYCKECLRKVRKARRKKEARDAPEARVARLKDGRNAIRSISTCVGMAVFGLRSLSDDHYNTIFLSRSHEMEKLINEDLELVTKKLISIESLLMWALEREDKL